MTELNKLVNAYIGQPPDSFERALLAKRIADVKADIISRRMFYKVIRGFALPIDYSYFKNDTMYVAYLDNLKLRNLDDFKFAASWLLKPFHEFSINDKAVYFSPSEDLLMFLMDRKSDVVNDSYEKFFKENRDKIEAFAIAEKGKKYKFSFNGKAPIILTAIKAIVSAYIIAANSVGEINDDIWFKVKLKAKLSDLLAQDAIETAWNNIVNSKKIHDHKRFYDFAFEYSKRFFDETKHAYMSEYFLL